MHVRAVAAASLTLISFSVVAASLAQMPLPDAESPPGSEPAQVVVNSQESLAAAVGEGFRDEAWESPTDLLPAQFRGLTPVGGPEDRSGKAAWRKAVVLSDESAAVKLAVNCYRLRDEPRSGAAPGTPFAPLREPDYRYVKAEFHGLRAATASTEAQEVFVFRDGDVLFKIEATGGDSQSRRKANAKAAEAIWEFRHP